MNKVNIYDCGFDSMEGTILDSSVGRRLVFSHGHFTMSIIVVHLNIIFIDGSVSCSKSGSLLCSLFLYLYYYLKHAYGFDSKYSNLQY